MMTTDEIDEALRARRITHVNMALDTDEAPVLVIVLQDGGRTLIEGRGDTLEEALSSVLERVRV